MRLPSKKLQLCYRCKCPETLPARYRDTTNNCTLIDMAEAIDHPPKWHDVADLLREQSPAVRDLSRYLLVMSMVDEHKAKIVGARAMRGRHYLRIETNVGEVFWILRLLITMNTELLMREEVKAILEERDDGEPRGER